jgi:hypothetical protein
MDETQRSIVVSMDDHYDGVAMQTLVIETAAKNRKPELTLEENAFCSQNTYEGFITSIDGDVAFGDTNCYTMLQKPSWLNYSIEGDTVRLWGDAKVSMPDNLFIKVLAVDSKGDSTIADFQVNIQRLYLLSSSKDTAIEDLQYKYHIQFNRLPNEPTFSFIRLPDWLQMDDQYWLIGTPQIHNLNDTLVHFTVSDRQCTVETEHTLAIHIEHVNHAPVITTARLPAAYEEENYNARVSAFDIDSLIEDVGLQYAVIPAWSWLNVDSQTGVLSGTPSMKHISDTVFQFIVQDRQGYSASKMLNIPVVEKAKMYFGNNLTCQIIQPTMGNFHYVEVQAEEHVILQYYIYNIAGYLVYASQKQNLERGTHYLPFDIRHQPLGIYVFVGMENNKRRYSITFLNYY